MELKCKFRWEMLEIPPRCRKARNIPHYKDVVATIREISNADADRLMPVALIVHDELYKDKYPDTQATHKPLYWYQGSLYAKDNRHTIDRLVDEFARDVQIVDNEADIETSIREIEQSYVIRDGVLCVMTYEPCYHISFSITSGPSIFIENIYDYDKLDDCDFRADELEQTIDAALNSEHYMDESRRQYLKDTKDNSCYIEVLMPEVLKMPSHLNRIGQNIEREVRHALLHDFQFEPDELKTEKGKKLIQTVMQAVYADKELKKRRYLHPSLDVERIFKQVIFDLVK